MLPSAVSAQGPTVTITSPLTVRPGDLISFTVQGGAATLTDWVALTPASQPDGSYLDWQYLNGTRTVPPSGIATASLNFVAPAVGSYNVRFYANNRLADKQATSATVVVSTTAPPPPPTDRWFRICIDNGATCYEGFLSPVPEG
jgi:hypothetical protein